LKAGIGPWTLAEIEEGTGISRSSLAAVIYRTHSGEFCSIDMPGSSRAKGWVLKESAIGQEIRESANDDDIPF
jgi:hypothetical protein